MDCSAEEDIELSTATARKYGLSLEVVDLHQEYWENVAAYAIDKIRQGLTPNPNLISLLHITSGFGVNPCRILSMAYAATFSQYS